MFIFFACKKDEQIKFGVYHYYDEKETNGLVSKTIRVNEDGTFVMFGLEIDSSILYYFEGGIYSTYITGGDWNRSHDYIILNTDMDRVKNHTLGFNIADTSFINIRPLNYVELVPNVINDSFLIISNGNALIENKTKFKLIYVKK